MADRLFLLKPGFLDPKAGPGAYYCPPCATITGLLTYHPELRAKIEVTEVGFQRPRAEVAAIFGENHPGSPVLVLDGSASIPAGITVKVAENGVRYIDDAQGIGQYLAQVHQVAQPH